jgi:hypothetical protein
MSSFAVPRTAPSAVAPVGPVSTRGRLRVVEPTRGRMPGTERVVSWPVVLALVLVLAGVVAFTAQLRSVAHLGERVDGHVMIEPGGSLWDVARTTAPAGTSPEAQLAAIQELNGLSATRVDGWTVVLLPAR